MAPSRLAILLAVLAALAAQGSANAALGRRWKPPDWCGSLDCPEYCLEKEYADYEIRTYRSARWVVTDESDEKYEIAFLKATHCLRAYMDGHNDEHDRLRHTTPVVAELRPNKDGTTTSRNYTFAMYLPDRHQGRHRHRIPAPLDSSVRVVKWEKDTLFVRTFTGFATEATIMNQMSELVAALEDDKRDYEERTVWVAVYDPPTKLIGRHNEVLMEASPRKRSGDMGTS